MLKFVLSPQILSPRAYAWEEARDIRDGAEEVEAPGIREIGDDGRRVEEK